MGRALVVIVTAVFSWRAPPTRVFMLRVGAFQRIPPRKADEEVGRWRGETVGTRRRAAFGAVNCARGNVSDGDADVLAAYLYWRRFRAASWHGAFVRDIAPSFDHRFRTESEGERAG